MSVVPSLLHSDALYSADEYELLSSPRFSDLDFVDSAQEVGGRLDADAEIEDVPCVLTEDELEEDPVGDSYDSCSSIDVSHYPIYQPGEAEKKIALYHSSRDEFRSRVLGDSKIFEAALDHCEKASAGRGAYISAFRCSAADKSISQAISDIKIELPRLREYLMRNRSEVDLWRSNHPGTPIPLEIQERISQRLATVRMFVQKHPFPIHSVETFYLRYLSDNSSLTRQFNHNRMLRDEISLHHYRLVGSLIPKGLFGVVSNEDLFQDGAMILQNAIDTYNPEYGLTFVSYASFRIKKGIMNCYGNNARLGSLKNKTYKLVSMAKRAIEQFTAEHGRAPDDNELADRLNIKRERTDVLRRVLVLETKSVSISALANVFEGNVELEDSSVPKPYEDDSGVDVFERAAVVTCRNIAREILDPRSYDIFERTHFRGQSYAATGKVYRITKERVRQILLSATEKIKAEYDSNQQAYTGEPEEKTEAQKASSPLFQEFRKDLTAGGLKLSMETLETYAGDKEFWYDFFKRDYSAVDSFRFKLAHSQSGFDIEKLSPDRKQIFLEFMSEWAPTLNEMNDVRVIATLLGTDRKPNSIRREAVQRGWISPDLPEGEGLVSPTNGKYSPYIVCVEAEQREKNIDTFLQRNFAHLDRFQNIYGQKGASAEALAKLLDCYNDVGRPDSRKLACYAARPGGPISNVLPEWYRPEKKKPLSYYLDKSVVGEERARANAYLWVRWHVRDLSRISQFPDFLPKLIQATSPDPYVITSEHKKYTVIAAELLKRGWITPLLSSDSEEIKSTKHIACNVEVVGSDAIVAYNKAFILGKELPDSDILPGAA